MRLSMDEPAEVTQEVGTPGQLAELYGALAQAQGEFQPITKNREVLIELKTFKYADLEEITSKTRPALSKNGLATTQKISVSSTGSGTSIFTSLMHKAGAKIESEIPLTTFMKGDIKEYGAAVTYMRRYAKCAILDVAADDDLDQNGKGAGKSDAPAGADPEPQTEEPNTYSQAAFDKNLPNWTAGVKAKKTTPNQIIAMVSTRAQLSDEQRQIILALSPETAE